MKFLLMIFSFNIFAGIGSSHGGSTITAKDLQIYLKQNNINVKASQISFQAMDATTFVPVFKLCTLNELYRTIEKQELYSMSSRNGSTVVGKDYLYRKMDLDEDNNPIDKKFNVDVFKTLNRKNENEVLLNSYQYKIPECEN